MIENNQKRLDEKREVVRNHWSRISEEDFARTQGDADQIVELIAQKYGESNDSVRRKLTELLRSSESEPITDQSQSGIVVDSSEPESQEWHARESTSKERGQDLSYE